MRSHVHCDSQCPTDFSLMRSAKTLLFNNMRQRKCSENFFLYEKFNFHSSLLLNFFLLRSRNCLTLFFSFSLSPIFTHNSLRYQENLQNFFLFTFFFISFSNASPLPQKFNLFKVCLFLLNESFLKKYIKKFLLENLF